MANRPMILTTHINSIKVKPRWLVSMVFLSVMEAWRSIDDFAPTELAQGAVSAVGHDVDGLQHNLGTFPGTETCCGDAIAPCLRVCDLAKQLDPIVRHTRSQRGYAMRKEAAGVTTIVAVAVRLFRKGCGVCAHIGQMQLGIMQRCFRRLKGNLTITIIA